MSLAKIKNLFDLEYIEENPEEYAKKATIEELEQLIKYANHYYHNTDKLLVSDYAYDELKDTLADRDPNNPVLTEVGAPVDGTKVKVKLPYWMGSMTKIKPGDGNMDRFTKKYKGKYVLSDKLDGISGLICFDHDKPISIYTRGEGNMGASIDYIAPYLNLPKVTKKIAVRGEFVIKKSAFADMKEKKQITYKNTRSFVAGVINHKTPNVNHLKLVDFVAYELIYPTGKTSEEQLQLLKKYNFNVVPDSIVHTVTEKSMEQYYINRLELSNYDIDGIIITDNNVYDRVTGENPKYSRAFKMDFKKYETKVLDIIWNASKDGLLKPVVVYEPVMIGGNKNVKATCNNARFLLENKIGIGAIINIIRTNDVLPKVVGVVKPSNKIKLPDGDYEWNKNKVEFILVNPDDNTDVAIQRLIRFFTVLKIDNINKGLIKLLYENERQTVDDILTMEVDDFLEMPGFKKKLATKIYENIHSVIDNPIPLERLMTASNAFQHGFAEKKLRSIINAFPDLLENQPDLEDILQIDGWDSKTAEPFLERFPNFIEFLEHHPYLKYNIKKKSKSKSNTGLNDIKVVFTGIRNKPLESIIEEMGGTVSASISKNTNIVITNEPDGTTSKLNKARDLGITILTIEQFVTKFNINLI
jgi:NAD-dependent DNA ligase